MSDWNNTISLKQNDKKGNAKAPDYKGSFQVEDKEYNFALWPAKSGNGYFGKVELRQPKEAQEEPKKASIDDEDDSTIPF